MALEIPKMIQDSDFPDGAKRVLAGAAEMFALKGFAATSVRQIAEAAELSVPMVYYYFPGKDDVFRALMQVGQDYGNRWLESVATDADLRTKLTYILRVNTQMGVENPRMVAMSMAAIFGPQEGRPSLPMTDTHEHHMHVLQSLFEDVDLRDGFTPRFLAGQFMALKNNLMLSNRALVDPAMAVFHDEIHQSFSDEGIARMVDHFLYGSLAPQQETL